MESFGWNVLEVDGNNIDELKAAFEAAKKVTDKPTCIIANTVKGYGGGQVMENKASWHHHVPNEEEYKEIITAIDERKEAVSNE